MCKCRTFGVEDFEMQKETIYFLKNGTNIQGDQTFPQNEYICHSITKITFKVLIMCMYKYTQRKMDIQLWDNDLIYTIVMSRNSA